MCPINIINSYLAENRFLGHRIGLILGKKIIIQMCDFVVFVILT